MDLREFRRRGGAPVRRHPWELARVEVVSRILDRAIDGQSMGNVLDLGCGDTFFAEQLSERFPSASIAAVDPAFDEAIRQRFQERLGGKPISLYHSLDEAQQQFPATVGLVLLLDVIEHVEDDAGFLQSLRRYSFIREDARVLITVPAYPSLFCSHDRFLGHYRRYTNASLADCVRRAGYVPRQAGYFFASLLLPRYLQVRRERAKGDVVETSGLVEWAGGRSRTALLRSALVLDFEVGRALRRLGLKLPGLSSYVLCQRSA